MKNIIITGASRGIGRACAVKMAEKNSTLYLNGRDEKELTATCKMVEEKGATAVPLLADLSVPQNVITMADQIKAASIDCLVNNAGIAVVEPLEEISLEVWQKTFDINVTAPFLLTQKLFKKFTGDSSVVNIISTAARIGYDNWSSYCMSKAALEGFMRAVRQELKDRGTRVINLFPGAVATDIWDNLGIEFDKSKMMGAEDIAEAVVMAVNQPQRTVVEDIVLKSFNY